MFVKIRNEIEKINYDSWGEILPYFFLVIAVWFSHFLLIDFFGFYEDDWHFLGTAVTNSTSENLVRIQNAYTEFFQGRPLYLTFVTLIPAIVSKIGGIKILYLVGFLILSTNVCLFYKLTSKIFDRPIVPLLSSLFLCLYPSDTTFIFLLHLFELQISLLFFLLAFIFFLDSRKIFSYIFIIGSLLTYETLFPVFLAAPLFLKKNAKREFIYHFFCILIISIVYLIIRRSLGESRVIGLDPFATFGLIIQQLFVGPLISAKMFFARWLEVLQPFKQSNIILLSICFPIFFVLILFFVRRTFVGATTALRQEKIKEIKKIFLIAMLMTILGYCTAFMLDINLVDGRASRVHFAASLGMSIMFACVWAGLLYKNFDSLPIRFIMTVLVSLQITFLFVFSFNVQQYYALSWKYQQEFWQDVLRLSPDINNNTVVLVQSPSLPWGRQINPFDWSVPSVLESIYYFPQSWDFPPRVYILNSNHQNIEGWKNMIDPSGKFVISNQNNGVKYHYAWEADRVVDAENIILLVEDNNRLVRQPSIKLANGIMFELKKNNMSNSLPPLSVSPIFPDLIRSSGIVETESSSPIYLKPQK